MLLNSASLAYTGLTFTRFKYREREPLESNMFQIKRYRWGISLDEKVGELEIGFFATTGAYPQRSVESRVLRDPL